MSGPLQNLKIIEMAGLGPGPFCAMMLADMGADVIRIDRKTSADNNRRPAAIERGRRSLAIDLKRPEAVDILRRLIARADGLIEGFRPGVMERLGLGPEPCLAANPRLVYGRMTGWGQTGPLAQAAGHDINYIAVTGALHAMGHADRPPAPPLHLVGDMGGGAMMLAFGMVCALFEAAKSGKGQVVDAAVCDGVSLLSTFYHDAMRNGSWSDARESNMLDGGAHFYGCYACADGGYVSIGAIEPQFYALLLERCGITDPEFDDQWDRARWPALRAKLEKLFLTRTRDEWCALLEGTDACFAPVLNFAEAARHPHAQARASFSEIDGMSQPAPAPRLSRTPAKMGTPATPGQHRTEILRELGMDDDAILSLVSSGVVA